MNGSPGALPSRHRPFRQGWQVSQALAGIVLLAGCTSPVEQARIESTGLRAQAHARMPERLASLATATEACEPMRAAGGGTWQAAADCYDSHLVTAFIVPEAPYEAAVYTNIAQRMRISGDVDRGATTPDQARKLLDPVDKTLAAAIRATVKPPDLTLLQKEHATDVAVHAELLQRQADTETLLKSFETMQPRP